MKREGGRGSEKGGGGKGEGERRSRRHRVLCALLRVYVARVPAPIRMTLLGCAVRARGRKRSHPPGDAINSSWVWDVASKSNLDGASSGFHAAQLVTVDLATGEHRFALPHRICGVDDAFSTFNAGRYSQWQAPARDSEIGASWRGSKWFAREWKPLVSFELALPPGGKSASSAGGARPFGGRPSGSRDSAPTARAGADVAPAGATAADVATAAVAADGPRCDESGSPDVSWAGAYLGGWMGAPPRLRAAVEGLTNRSRLSGEGEAPAVHTAAILRRPAMHRRRAALRAGGVHRAGAVGRRGRLSARITRLVRRRLEAQFAVADWLEWGANVSVQTTLSDADTIARVWVYFPTFHGERETMNGFCEDKQCACTGVLASCHRHPECRGKHVCQPLPAGSARFVDHARAFAAAVGARGAPFGRVRAAGGGGAKVARGAPAAVVSRRALVTPWYDDCWPGRGRCQGHRPCKEPLDQAFSCRATAMLCPDQPWRDALADAKKWVPFGHPAASLLYVYDGHWNGQLFDETFRTWGPSSVGYGAHAVIFGPQFGKFDPRREDWTRSLQIFNAAMSRAEGCGDRNGSSPAGAGSGGNGDGGGGADTTTASARASGGRDAGPAGGSRSGRAPVAIFRSPAFNFDNVNSFAELERYESKMRPIVEAAGVLYLDQYAATRQAAFQAPPAIRFAQGSTFHYLNAGRYLMAQTLIHLLHLLTHGAAQSE